MSRTTASPSYSPTMPAYQPRSTPPSPSPPPSPVMWEAPQSPGGWSDSTVLWSFSDREQDFDEFPTSPWPQPDPEPEDYLEIEAENVDFYEDVFGTTLPREDEEEVVEPEESLEALEYVTWSDSTNYVSDPEE